MKQSRTRQRLLSFVAAVALAVTGLAPTVALADTVTVTTAAELTDAVKGGKNVELGNDIAADVTVPAGVTVNIDLNGKKLTNVSGNTITNNGTLTITGEGTVDNVSHGKAAVYNNETGVATLNGGTYTRSKEDGTSNSNSFYTLLNHGTMTISDGVEVNQGPNGNAQFSSLVENGWYNGKQKPADAAEPKLTINGGKFTGGLNTIKNDDYGVLEINKGAFTNVAQAAVLNWNKATIKGGTFESSQSCVLNGKIDDSMDKGELTISGGKFTAPTVVGRMDSRFEFGSAEITDGAFSGSFGEQIDGMKVSGGTFTHAPAAKYLASGYTPVKNANGTYDVKETPKVAEVDGVKYETVNEAIAAANGKTVKLLDDVNEDVVVPSGVTVTLDLNGKTLTNVSSDTITNNGTLTITGEGTVDNVTNGKAAILNKGTLNLEGGTITRSAEPEGQTPADGKGNSYYVVFNTSGATLNVKDDATIKGISAFSSAVRNDGNMTVSGGLIQQDDFIAVKNDSGTLVVKGGTIKSANDQAIQNWKDATIEGGELDGNVTSFAWGDEASSTKITGGTINGDVSAINYVYNGNEATAAPVIEISGDAVVNGKLYAQKGTSANPAKNENVTSGSQATVTVSGGSFSNKVPEDMAAEGLEPTEKNEDGTYTVAKQYEVTFKANNGSQDTVTKVFNGKTVAKPADPAKAGFVFAGWFTDEALTSAYDFDAPVTGDVTLYAKWAAVHKVTFVYGTGADDLVVEVVDGQAVTKPSDPTYEGWNFEVWFLVKNADGTLDVDSEYDFATPVKADMKIYAGWTEVKPADDGNTTNPEQPKPADGKAEQKPAAATPKTGDATSNAPLAVAVVAGAGLLIAGVALGKRREH